MRPQHPSVPSFKAQGLASPECTERLKLMAREVDELAVEIGLGGSDAADLMTGRLLGGLGGAVSAIAMEHACGQAGIRMLLDAMADKLDAATHRRCYPRHETDRMPEAKVRQVLALIARLRLVARN